MAMGVLILGFKCFRLLWEKKENNFSFRLFYFNLLLCTFERLPNAVAYKPRVVQLLICQTFKHLDFVVWVIFQISLKYFSPVLWDISFDLCKIFPSRAGCWKWGSLNWRLGWSLARLSTKLQTFSCSLAYFTNIFFTNTITKIVAIQIDPNTLLANGELEFISISTWSDMSPFCNSLLYFIQR